MLRRLTVENYALIDRLDIEFSDGLNIITGETGAGKSILLGALGLLVGNRAEGGTNKDAEKNCVVEGTFNVEGYDLAIFFAENDLDYDDTTVVRRIISASGKSRAYINELPVQLTVLKEFGAKLIDIHSQHQSLMLSDDAFRTNIIDSVAQHSPLLGEYKVAFDSLHDLQQRRAKLVENAQQNSRDLEFITFQFEQLNEAKLRDGEKEELENELNELSNAELIRENLGLTYDAFGVDETGVISQLSVAESAMTKIKDVYARGGEFAERVHATLVEIKDIERELSAEVERIESDPHRLMVVETRLALIFSLEQKHKVATVAQLIDIMNSYGERLSLINDSGEAKDKLEKEIKKSYNQAVTLSGKITQNRKKAAVGVKQYIEKILAQLGMPNATIDIEIAAESTLRRSGADSIRFMFSSNKGFAPQPIDKVASGGEISRVMLGIKSLIAKSTMLPTIIFDEIDTGVSGKIADSMGDIIAELSESLQVINITHLPQVASKGSNHFVVYKEEDSNSARTQIRKLTDEERIDEIAKMLSGNKITEAAIAQANTLLGN